MSSPIDGMVIERIYQTARDLLMPHVGAEAGIRQAGAIADGVAAELAADPDARELHLVQMTDGGGMPHVFITPSPPARSRTLWTLNVADLRRAARQHFAEQYQADIACNQEGLPIQ